MDVWQWIGETQEALYEQGNERLADLIDDVPRAVVDLQHDQVDALVPEALHLAREAGSPWLEVFFRHWNLQSQVFHRHRVSEALPEAVALLDFAHRNETRDCPQSVCAVQDLAHCYAELDGPGYVEERLAIASETLERIDAEWACFTCISGEKAEALLDDGRYEETLQFVEDQAGALLRAGLHHRHYNLRVQKVEALIRLGRYDEAAEYNSKARKEVRQEYDILEQRLDAARILAYQGQHKQAAKKLPGFQEIRPTDSYFRPWAETVRLLAQHDAIGNDGQLDGQFRMLSEKLSGQGANYGAAVLGLWRAELALWRDDTATAAAVCDQVAAMAARLRRPEAIQRTLAELRSR